MPKRLQYDVLTEGISNAQALERTQIDKWQGNNAGPQSAWAASLRAGAVLLAMAPALALVAPPSLPTVPARTTPEAPVFSRVNPFYLMASGTVEPILPPVVVPITSVDRYGAAPALPAPITTNRAYLVPATLGPISPTFSETITPDKWFVEAARPRFDLARTQYLFPTSAMGPISPTYAERPTPDKWLPSVPDRLFDQARTPYLDPASAFAPLPIPPPPGTPVSGWYITTDTPRWDVPRLTHLIPDHAAGPISPTFGERITPDKWLGNYPDALNARGTSAPLAPVTAPVTVAPTSTAASWQGMAPALTAPILNVAWLRTNDQGDPLLPPSGGGSSLASWQEATHGLVVAALQTAYLRAADQAAPVLVPAPPVPLDRWFVAAGRPPAAPARLTIPDGSSSTLLPIAPPPVVPLDRWYAEPQRPTWGGTPHTWFTGQAAVLNQLPLPGSTTPFGHPLAGTPLLVSGPLAGAGIPVGGPLVGTPIF